MMVATAVVALALVAGVSQAGTMPQVAPHTSLNISQLKPPHYTGKSVYKYKYTQLYISNNIFIYRVVYIYTSASTNAPFDCRCRAHDADASSVHMCMLCTTTSLASRPCTAAKDECNNGVQRNTGECDWARTHWHLPARSNDQLHQPNLLANLEKFACRRG